MYNPLFESPTKLKDSEIENKVLELTKKYHIAARMGQGAAVSQIIAALEMYKEEQSKRFAEMSKNGFSKQNNGLNDLINVE